MNQIKAENRMPRVNDLGVSFNEFAQNLDKQLKLAYKKLYGTKHNLKMKTNDNKQ